MKLLLDSCLSGKAAALLRDIGHDVVWAGDWPADPGDAEILVRARVEGRVLVTLDKDFGELAIVRGEPHCGIVRLVDCTVGKQAERCGLVMSRHGDLLAAGGIVTAEAGRLRIRPAGS
jgi:predicted nuclease of predicted toxin-antitoxin system